MKRDDASPLTRRYMIWIVVAAAVLAAGAYVFINGGPGIKPDGPPEQVTIACSIATDAALAHVAQSLGFYRKEGLEAAVRLYPYGKLALQDLLEGKADFATVAEAPVMFAILKGEKIAIIATIQATNQTNAIIARRDRGINTPGDLRGRKIAATMGTTQDYFLDAILAAEGIFRKEVTIVDLATEKMTEALERGDVDAASLFSPYTAYAQMMLGGAGITFKNRDIYTSTFSIVATQEFIHRNPEKVKKLLRALIRAEDFIQRHVAEAQEIVAAFSGVDIAVVREVWASQNFAVSLDQSLILALEDESDWAIRNRLTGSVTKIPNYLNFIHLEGLKTVKPKAITIFR